jgi:hypothetical protein
MPNAGDQINVVDINAAQAGSNLRPMCRLLQVGSALTLVNGANTTMTWDTEDFDYGGLHVAGSANVIVTKAGVWKARGSLLLPARTDWQTVGACIARNGVNLPTFERWGPSAVGNQRSVTVTTNALYAVGDTISLVGFQTNVAAASVVTAFGSSFENSFDVEFIRDA